MSKRKSNVQTWFQKEKKKTSKELHRKISSEELAMLTSLTFVVVALQVGSMLLNLWNWANNPGLSYESYHIYAPVVGFFGWAGYAVVLHAKRVQTLSMLPFVPAVVGIIYNGLLTLIRYNMLDPTILKWW